MVYEVFIRCYIYGLFICYYVIVFFFFKQKTAYEMRISDWSSDVCSSDLRIHRPQSTVVCCVDKHQAYVGFEVVDVRNKLAIEQRIGSLVHGVRDRKSVV